MKLVDGVMRIWGKFIGKRSQMGNFFQGAWLRSSKIRYENVDMSGIFIIRVSFEICRENPLSERVNLLNLCHEIPI